MTLSSATPVDPGVRTIQLQGDRLAVTVAAPGLDYRGSRFDWTTFVTDVRLDGGRAFCVPESVDGSGTGGVGLCCEFGIQHAVGFDDAGPGEPFLKPGVGVLTRPDQQPYSFSRDYAVQAFDRRAWQEGETLHLLTEPRDCRGFALRLERTLRVEGAGLLMESQLDNVGQRPLFTDEYCHNFVAMDQRPTAPGLTLSWSRQAWPTLLAGMDVTPGGFTWTRVPPGACYGQIAMQSAPAGQDSWTLRDSATGLMMRETTSERWARFALFSTPRLVSPEGFIDIQLDPGRSKSWWRRFEFGYL